MGFVDRLFRGIVPDANANRAIDSFTDYPGLTEQLLAVQGITPRPWSAPSIREAMSVPAIFRAVSLISNLVGSFPIEAFRNGDRMTSPPRVVQRPNPFTTPREFFGGTAYNLATRGEAFWYVGARDNDGLAISLIPVDPREVRVEWDDRRIEPIYTWRGKVMAPGQLRHITYLREPGSLRGFGPLQLCGAAVSSAIEANEWAARFFAEGGVPAVNLHSAVELTGDEAAALKTDWTASDAPSVRVTSGPLELRDIALDPERAQLLQARMASNGDAATMFGLPGHLLAYSQPGSSLTYQSLDMVATEAVRFCIAPNYLEPIEQEFSELLTSTTVSRFNVEGLLRADVKTRWEVYESAVAVLGPEEGAAYAREREGLEPGSIETMPVPSASPAAIPTGIPERI